MAIPQCRFKLYLILTVATTIAGSASALLTSHSIAKLKSSNCIETGHAWRSYSLPCKLSKVRTWTSSLKMCICINCKYVTTCKAYHFVEEKHEQPHMTENPTFSPRNGSPVIHVNIRTSRADPDAVARIWSEHNAKQKLAEQRAALKGTDVEQEVLNDQQYDLSVQTTYEYDVVACEDFVEEHNCWINNMPEEIKRLNPAFVPT